MASISSLIGLDRTNIGQSAETLSKQTRADPEDYPLFARDAKRLDQDIRTAYTDALNDRYIHEMTLDRHFLERARKFVELNEQVETSTQLLVELASFLSTFQTDLSAVSGHIAELQGRSKTIEGRLRARKAVQRSLQPFLESITISPSLINTILDSQVSAAWIPAIIELDQKLGAVRGGARVESRRQLDQASEALRISATMKISNHLNSLLKPYTTTLSSLTPLHSSLLTYKPLFDFLRRHSARQAHEFQKSYSSTIRWYHETAFRRYVRSLEGLRTRTNAAGGNGFKWDELVSTGNDSQASLALLNAKRKGAASNPVLSVAPGRSGLNISESSKSAILNSRLGAHSSTVKEEDDTLLEEEAPIIAAWQTNDKNLQPTYELLFRSISVVLAHNSAQEYHFLDSFFGVHSSLPILGSVSPAPENVKTSLGGGLGRMRRLGSNGSISAFSASVRGAGEHQTQHGGVLSAVGESETDDRRSESSRTVISAPARGDHQQENDKMRKILVEGLWKSVMEPALEYSYNFAHALLAPPSAPSPLSTISMINLNNAILSQTTVPPSPLYCPPLESHLYSIRLLLWPLLTKTLDVQIESLKRINGSSAATASTGVGGFLGRMTGGSSAGGSSAAVKDSTVQAILERYVEWFVTIVEVCAQKSSSAGPEVEKNDQQAAEDEPVFSLMLRLRAELDKLLVHQSRKIPDHVKQKAFLKAGYQEIVTGLSLGLTRHDRIQREIAHYRELERGV